MSLGLHNITVSIQLCSCPYTWHVTSLIILLSLDRKFRIFFFFSNYTRDTFNLTSLVAQTVKRLSTMRETRVRCGRSLGWEDPPEKEMAIHSSTIPWKIPWTEEPGRLQSVGSQKVGHDWVTSLSLLILIPKQRFFRKPNWPLILTISEVKNLKIAHLFSNSVTEDSLQILKWATQITDYLYSFIQRMIS